MKEIKHIPEFLQPFLWSYDLVKLDMERDKKTIIKQILEYGTMQAVEWLRFTYSEDEIRSVIESVPLQNWSRKSLALWSLVYNVSPTSASRKF